MSVLDREEKTFIKEELKKFFQTLVVSMYADLFEDAEEKFNITISNLKLMFEKAFTPEIQTATNVDLGGDEKSFDFFYRLENDDEWTRLTAKITVGYYDLDGTTKGSHCNIFETQVQAYETD